MGSSAKVGKDNILDFDPNDIPHISYYDDAAKDLKYAVWTDNGGGQWIIERVDTGGLG